MATFVFSDIIGFTALSGQCSPSKPVQMLDVLVKRLEGLCFAYEFEKTKTIGDA